MQRAFTLVAISMLISGCGGGQTPAQSPPDVAAEPAAAPEPATAPTAKPAEADEGAWAGEAEAKSQKAPDSGGKEETRTMEVVAQVVKTNRQAVRDCYDKARKDLPDLHGDMVIHFVLDPDGKVKKAELNQERSSLKSPAVVDCALKVISGIKFPPSSRGMDTTVNYPYNFTP